MKNWIDTLRQFQSLLKRAAIPSVYLLLGALPIEAELHKRQLSFLYILLSAENVKFKRIIERQLCENFDNKDSFFYCIIEVLFMYNLPSILHLQKNLPKKLQWKKMIMTSISSYWNELLLNQAHSTMSSLKYLSKDNLRIGNPHSIYRTVKPSIMDVRKCIIKTCMITRTYTLQADRHKFNRYEVEPLCQLCNIESEDLPHMLTTCVTFVDIRNALYIPIKHRVINLIGPRKWNEMFNNRLSITKLILDCSNFTEELGNQQNIDEIETLCRNYSYKLHNKILEVVKMVADT